MTDEKFKDLQNKVALAMGTIFLMVEDDFIVDKKPFTDKIGNEYIRRVTKKVKEDKQFAENIISSARIIAEVIKEVFQDE